MKFSLRKSLGYPLSFYKKFIKSFSGKLQHIPVIDISPLRNGTESARKEVGRQIDEANKDIGFIVVKNSGIDFKFVSEVIETADKFFSSPMENKMKCRVNTPEQKPYGYYPRNFEALQRTEQADIDTKYVNDVNESYNLQSANPKSLCPERIFPEYPKEFSTVMNKYWNECDVLARTLMKGFAYGLGVEPCFFESKLDHSASVVRLIHYPEGVKLQPGQYRISEHTDYGSLTILYSTAEGLQVKTRKGEWVNVQIPWEHFVINIGDLMAFWTNDRWVSTPHRVVSKDNENPHKRFSIVYFQNPNHDALIECIPTCKDEKYPAKYKPILSQDFVLNKFRTSIGEAKKMDLKL